MCILKYLLILNVYRNAPVHDKTFINITKTRLFKNIENFTTKNWKFSDKISDIFHTSAQNIDCGYSLEPPRRGGSNEYPQSMFCRGGSNEYPQSMFLRRNKNYNEYPCITKTPIQKYWKFHYQKLKVFR